MANERPILILTASAGAGHLTAARALAEAFRAAAPDTPLEVHDVLQSSAFWFRRLYGDGYLWLVKHLPFAMGELYDATDRPGGDYRDALRIMAQEWGVGGAYRYILERRPRLVVNTHFLPAELVARLRRAQELDCPQVTITTDYETHRLWAQPPTERYYTATEVGKAYLSTWGVPLENIVVSGIPVRSAFERSMDQEGIRRRENLDLHKPMVLLLCGGFGVGPTEELLRELLAMPGDPRIVVVTGRNEKLYAQLSAIARLAAPRVRVLGFSDKMHEWMRAADLVITKPGGLTVSEALVCGLPLVVVSPIPGQETRNSDYLLERGAAIKVNHPRLLGHCVSRLLEDPARLQALKKAAQSIAPTGAAARIAADALRLLEQ